MFALVLLIYSVIMSVSKVIIASSPIPLADGGDGRAFSVSAAIMVSCSENRNHNMVCILMMIQLLYPSFVV